MEIFREGGGWVGRGGGPGPTARKQSGHRLFCPQLILQLTEGSNGFITEKTIPFPRIQRGYNIFQGGPTFSLGGGGGGRGSNANFYRNPYDL